MYSRHLGRYMYSTVTNHKPLTFILNKGSEDNRCGVGMTIQYTTYADNMKSRGT